MVQRNIDLAHLLIHTYLASLRQLLLSTNNSQFLQIFHVLKLGEGQDITAFALNEDNTNLLVSTAGKQLIIFTDPAVS